MNKMVKRLLIAAGVCIVVGGGLMGVGAATGGFAQLDDAESGLWLGERLGGWFGSQGGSVRYRGGSTEPGQAIYNGDFEAEIPYSGMLSELEVELGAHGLTIEEGTGDKIYLSGTRADRIQCFVKDGKLQLKDVGKNKKYTQTNGRTLVLIVPADICWEDAELEAAVGYIEAQRMEAEELELSAPMGAVEIAEVEAQKADLSASMGSIEIGSLVANELEAEVSMGSIVIDSGALDRAEFEGGMGSMQFAGTISGNVSAEISMGDITLALDQSGADFDYEISAGMGTVTVDDVQYTNVKGMKRLDNGAGRKMKLNSSMGAIDISFR